MSKLVWVKKSTTNVRIYKQIKSLCLGKRAYKLQSGLLAETYNCKVAILFYSILLYFLSVLILGQKNQISKFTDLHFYSPIGHFEFI